MNPGAFAVRNRALVNAAVIVTVVVGLIALAAIPRELNPKVSFNWAFVGFEYTGANPEEVENLVTIPIEDEMQAVDDVDVIVSQSRRGSGFIWIRFEQISDREFERRLDDVRARLPRVDLPEAVEDPVVDEFSSYDFEPVLTVVVRGTAAERVLHDLADDLSEDLRDVPGVDDVDVFGDRERAILVECDPHLLAAHRLDITDVENALRLANLNLPAGVVKLGEEFVLRTRSEFTSVDEIATVALVAGAGGSRVRIGDVAAVSDGFEDRTLVTRYNGEPSITLSITKREDGNTIEIARGVRELLAEWQDQLPAGVKLEVSNDQSERIGEILGVLESNAVLGLVLVVAALVVFVGWQGALVAALGIPVTFLIAIAFMHWTGQSLNGSTLFGLILVLGMVVDDAVVVLENAFRHLEQGKERAAAAVDGVRQVVSPVVVSSLTTMGGFLPLVLMPGTTGKFMRIVPIVVSLVLVASLIEALWVLPSHFVDIVRRAPRRRGAGARWWEKAYLAALTRFLPARYLVVAASAVLLVGSALLIPLIGVDIFADEEIPTFRVFVTLPDGTRLERTDAVLAEFERLALALPADELEGVTANAGIIQGDEEWTFGPHLGQLVVDVVDVDERRRSLDEIMNDLRRQVATVPGPIKVEFSKVTGGPPKEAPVQLMVKGEDLDVVAAAAGRLREELAAMPGVVDVTDDLDLGQRELDVEVDREAAARRGLDPTRIARAVGAAFGGVTATLYRDGDEEIDVVVRYPESFRTSADAITGMRFVSPAGGVVPFTEVARLEERRGPVTIRRHDRDRQVTIKANVDQAVTDIGRVNRDVFRAFERLKSAYPGVRLEPGGQFQEFLEAFNSLVVLFSIGLLINFMLMAGQFKNWTQPLAIMAVVPLSFIGAMLGLLMTGRPFSIATLYGFVALAGVAVNDSIVLVDFINQARRAGFNRRDSLIEAGRIRLRPILLTSVTTILGLLPMALGLGGSSDVWQPLATTIAAGLAVATVISLLVIPCMQAILDDLARLARRLWRRGAEPVQEVQEPAPSGSG